MTQSSGILDRTGRWYRLSIGAASVVIIAAGIRHAAALLDSILLAAVLAMAVVPAFDALRRKGVSKALSAVLTTVLLTGVVAALVGLIAVAASQLVRVLPAYQDRTESLWRGIEGWLIARGVQPGQVLSLDLVDPTHLLRLAAVFLGEIGQVLSQTLLLILIVAYALVERGPHSSTTLPEGMVATVAHDVRQYLLITSASGLAFAIPVYVLMRALGTDLALVWAVLAFVLNFVPNIGLILSLIPPVILTLLEFSWQRASLILAGYVALNFIVDNLIKPHFLKSGLDVPPLLGLLSLLVWSYLLGPPGALLAIPLTLAGRRLLHDVHAVRAPLPVSPRDPASVTHGTLGDKP